MSLRGARLLGLAVTALCLALLAACGGPDTAPRPPSSSAPPAKAPKGTYKPYTVGGKTYRPLTTADGYVEEGTASWYGEPFHGRRTASGTVYDMYQLTAAHKLLPMNTRLKVTNLENGRSVELTVNDRGPFVGDRIIDLSYGSALKLGMAGQGLVPVRIESVGAVEGLHDGDLDGAFYVQVGAFVNRANAERLATGLRQNGHPQTRVEMADVAGTTFWRVQIGVYPTLSRAETARDRLAATYTGAFILNSR